MLHSAVVLHSAMLLLSLCLSKDKEVLWRVDLECEFPMGSFSLSPWGIKS